MSAYRVLMTKKISPELVEKAKKAGVELIEIAFISIEPCDEKDRVVELAASPANVAFTSKNAVNIVASFLDGKKPTWRIFCIEGATRDQVEACFGDNVVAGTAADADRLASVIIENDPGDEVVFFCGDKRRDDLPDKLSDNDIDVNEVTVYETKLSPEEIGEHFDGIAFFSPSAVKSFFSVNVVDDKTIFFSIGDTTTADLKKFAGNRIITSDKPSEENMVDTILGYIKQTNE